MNPRVEEAKKRLIENACGYGDRHYDEATCLLDVGTGDHHNRENLYCALAYLMTGAPERVARAKGIIRALGILRGNFGLTAAVAALLRMDHLLDDEIRTQFRDSVRAFIDVPHEDIISGRNVNIPMQAWTVRIAAGHWFDRPDLVAGGLNALERLAAIVEDHGTIPEFNSPVYHSVMLSILRSIVDIGEPRTSALAARLERHLWEEAAWRFHPNLHVLAGPYSRVYQDGLVGGGSLVHGVFDLLWGALVVPETCAQYDHDYEFNSTIQHVGQLDGFPSDLDAIALGKPLPVTVTSATEIADVRLGDCWAPGGIADVTTWMDAHLSVGTASRPFGHGMQTAAWVAQWTRTGNPVAKLEEFGQAFTRFAQNGRRPGDDRIAYRNHFNGTTINIGKVLWAEDGRAFAFQSGPTALVLYVPKAQERRWISALDCAVVVPRLDTVEEVLVDGQPVNDGFDGPADASVVIRSGVASLGVRFVAVDPSLVTPRLRVERVNNHLIVAIRLVEFPHERELPESVYRRYGASVGTELRFTPTADDVARLVHDMRESTLTDGWGHG